MSAAPAIPLDSLGEPAIPFIGYSRDRIDDAIVNPDLYASGEIYDVFAELRAKDAPQLMRPRGYRPFYAIVKHGDILEIEKNNQVFVNGLRTYLSPIQGEAWTMATFGDTHVFRTLVDLDDPVHMKLRALTQSFFMPPNLKKLDERIAALAKEHVDHMKSLGGKCDFVKEIALWYPLRVLMMIMGLPRSDEQFLMKMTQEIFGPGDPDVAKESENAGGSSGAFGADSEQSVDLFKTATQLFEFFGKITADRRANPTDDLCSVIANGKIDGAPIGDREAMSYYIIVATAGHDTTSSTAAGGLLELIKDKSQLEKLKADPSLMANAVEEMIRWVTPVKHFMRTATEDYVLRGHTIKAGEGLCLHYPSGNRDETVFEEPNKFKVDRQLSKQVAFGHGVHLCLGMHLARMEIKALFNELLPRLKSIELDGEPKNTRANFVSGLKTLPIRYEID